VVLALLLQYFTAECAYAVVVIVEDIIVAGCGNLHVYCVITPGTVLVRLNIQILENVVIF